MRILFVCPNLPWPLTNGSHIRIYHLAKRLAQRHEIRLFSLVAHEPSPQDLAPLMKFCAEARTFVRSGRRMLNAARGLWGKPFSLRNYWSPDLAKALYEVDRDVDVFHFNCLHTAQYAQPGQPSVFDSHNVEHILWERYVDVVPNTLRRLFCLRQAALMRGWEQRVTATVSETLACSKEDAVELSPQAVIAPNAVEFAPPLERKPTGAEFLYMGDMAWRPNVDAAEFLVKEILPYIQRSIPDARVTIVGVRPSKRVQALAGPQVEVTGGVPDVGPYLARATALVVPLRCGSGTRLKILEAMARGVPVVSTPVGCEGLEAKSYEHFVVADGAESLAEACLMIAQEPELGAALARNARELVQSQYTWERTVAIVEKVYRRVVSNSS